MFIYDCNIPRKWEYYTILLQHVIDKSPKKFGCLTELVTIAKTIDDLVFEVDSCYHTKVWVNAYSKDLDMENTDDIIKFIHYSNCAESCTSCIKNNMDCGKCPINVFCDNSLDEDKIYWIFTQKISNIVYDIHEDEVIDGEELW